MVELLIYRLAAASQSLALFGRVLALVVSHAGADLPHEHMPSPTDLDRRAPLHREKSVHDITKLADAARPTLLSPLAPQPSLSHSSAAASLPRSL